MAARQAVKGLVVKRLTCALLAADLRAAQGTRQTPQQAQQAAPGALGAAPAAAAAVPAHGLAF